MNVTLLNGAPIQPRSPLFDALRGNLLAGFGERGWKTAVHDLSDMAIRPCRGCFACWVRTPGRCIIRDDGDRVMADLANAEVVALLTPVTFGGYGYELKKAMDRAIPILLPFMEVRGGEIHHPLRYGVRRRLLAVGVLPGPDPDAERVFRFLAGRNALNMDAAGSSVLVLNGEAPPADLPGLVGDALSRLEVA